jgi:TolB-like protein/tetratricopeptide (TPR) repeat protein
VDRIPTGAAFAALGSSNGARIHGELHTGARSIAVLPFSSLSPDPADEAFADGLTDEIITDLSRVQALRVTSRNSVLRYKGSGKDVRTIGRELQVPYVLEGSVRCEGPQLRVIACVVDAGTDSQIWAERYTGTRTDLFAIQEHIARQIARALDVALTPTEERRLVRRPIQNLQAFESYVRARQLSVRFTPHALGEAMTLVDQAIALEGQCAPLLALKGALSWNMHNIGATGGEALEMAGTYVDRALTLDPELGDALVAKALITLRADRVDMGGVLRLLHAACEAERSADAYMWMTLYLSQTGRPELAVAYGRMASVLDPLTPIVGGIAAIPYVFMGVTDEGLRIAAGALERDPGDEVTRFLVGALESVAGRFDQAAARFDEPDPSGVWGDLARLYRLALAGNRREVVQLASGPSLTQVVRLDEQFSWLVARVLAYVDERDAAMRALQQAAVRGFVNARLVGEVDAMLAGLRGDAEFCRLLEFMRRRAIEIANESGF